MPSPLAINFLNMSGNSEFIAARSMLAILDSPSMIAKTDERLFEGLLAHCLTILPGLESSLSLPTSTEGSTYSLGRSGYPDVVRFSNSGHYEVGIELKLRSAHNLQHRKSELPRWQLDGYAENAQDTTALFILAPASKRLSLQREFAAYGPDEQLESIDRWSFIDLAALREAIVEILADRANEGSEAADLVLTLARLNAPLRCASAPQR